MTHLNIDKYKNLCKHHYRQFGQDINSKCAAKEYDDLT